MIRYILDTDILSLMQDGNAVVVGHCLQVPADEIAVSVISVEEILASWFTFLRRAKTKQRVALAYRRLAESAKFLGCFEILSYSEQAIDRFEELRRLKLGVRSPDLRIAATALQIGATVITRNVSDFQRIPGLVFVDWSQP